LHCFIITRVFISPVNHRFDLLSASVGSAVTITGNGFDPIPGNNIVYFGATKAVVVSASPSQLAVTVPVGATYQPITFTTGGLTVYSAKNFKPLFGCPPLNFSTSILGNKVNLSSGYYSSPTSIAIADFDGDGKPDIAVTNNTSSISIFRTTGAPGYINALTFAPQVSFPTPITSRRTTVN
jgi:hypothetical protein